MVWPRLARPMPAEVPKWPLFEGLQCPPSPPLLPYSPLHFFTYIVKDEKLLINRYFLGKYIDISAENEYYLYR
jgi:hypothetical protein